MTIEVVKTERFGYTILFNNEIIMECVGEDELKEISIGELIKFAKEGGLISEKES